MLVIKLYTGTLNPVLFDTYTSKAKTYKQALQALNRSFNKEWEWTIVKGGATPKEPHTLNGHYIYGLTLDRRKSNHPDTKGAIQI